MKNNLLNKNNKTPLLFLVFILSIIGCVFIYSASRYSAVSSYGDSLYFVKKQIIGVIIGTICMIITSKIDYHFWEKISLAISIFSFILLILVFVPQIGVKSYGASRWVKVGPVTLQPSEIAKFSLILFSATYFSKKPERTQSFLGIIPVLLYGLSYCVLIIIEPNMSITVCVAGLLISILFISGVKIKYIIFLMIPAILCCVILIIIAPYRLSRLVAFLDPWSSPKGEGYQLLQSLYALGSGGWFGVGLFNSRQKYAFLPFAESDFILSIIGEEIGFVGIIFFFSLLFLIIACGLKIMSKSQDFFGQIMSGGITLIFGIQVIINALVVSGSIPPTGLPLPLVSSGNTAIIIFMSEFGIVHNISKTT